MREILDTVEFFREVRKRLRFGEFSRLPLRLMRFGVTVDSAECEWFMRPPDPWDANLPDHLREEHMTKQALADALKMRELIFLAFPVVQRAELKMYRESQDGVPALMMTGTILRETQVLPRVASMVMRAKLYGFQFSLEGGVLESMGSSAIHAGC